MHIELMLRQSYSYNCMSLHVYSLPKYCIDGHHPDANTMKKIILVSNAKYYIL